MPLLSRFFGRTVGEGAGVAIGTAVGSGVEPAVQQLANTMQEHFRHAPLDPHDAALVEVRAKVNDEYPGIDLGDYNPEHDAKYSGVRPERFAMLRALAREHPTVGQLLTLRRRRRALRGEHGIGQAEYREWLRRQGFTTEVIDAITKLLTNYLSPEDIANAVQQGFVPGDGILPPPPGGRPPYEPPVEEVQLDTKGVFKTSGMDEDDLKVLAQLSGNPPGPEELLEMWRREKITETAVERGIREGRTKTKWTPAIKEMLWHLIPTAALVNLRLRGWIDNDAYHRRMLLHGYQEGVADDMFHAIGRPATVRQVLVGLRRGGVYEAPLSDTPQPFRDAIIRSDIRPEWANLLYEGRETYPSAFVVRRLVSEGALTADQGHDVLYKAGWPDDLARLAANSWAQGTGTTAKGLTATDLANEYEALWLTRAQYIAALKEIDYTQASAEAKADAEDARRARKGRDALVARIHTQYVAHRISRDTAIATLASANVPARVRDSLLPDWDLERSITPDALTPAQIKKAFAHAVFTRPEAIVRLEAKGYDEGDANIYLDE